MENGRITVQDARAQWRREPASVIIAWN